MIKIYKPRYLKHSTFSEFRFIFTSKFSVSIHRIESADPLRSFPHDHGCDFYSFILKGGYGEKFYKNIANGANNSIDRKFKLFSSHIFRGHSAHIITQCKKITYTIFITWNHDTRPPLIYTPDGAVTFGEYFSKKLFIKYGNQDPVEEL